MSRWHDPKGWRQRLARRLSFLADRIDPAGAPRKVSVSFTFEDCVGFSTNEDGRGCPLWYLGDDDYDRAFTEAERKAMRVDWKTMKIIQRPDPDPPTFAGVGLEDVDTR